MSRVESSGPPEFPETEVFLEANRLAADIGIQNDEYIAMVGSDDSPGRLSISALAEVFTEDVANEQSSTLTQLDEVQRDLPYAELAMASLWADEEVNNARREHDSHYLQQKNERRNELEEQAALIIESRGEERVGEKVRAAVTFILEKEFNERDGSISERIERALEIQDTANKQILESAPAWPIPQAVDARTVLRKEPGYEIVSDEAENAVQNSENAGMKRLYEARVSDASQRLAAFLIDNAGKGHTLDELKDNVYQGVAEYKSTSNVGALIANYRSGKIPTIGNMLDASDMILQRGARIHTDRKTGEQVGASRVLYRAASKDDPSAIETFVPIEDEGVIILEGVWQNIEPEGIDKNAGHPEQPSSDPARDSDEYFKRMENELMEEISLIASEEHSRRATNVALHRLLRASNSRQKK